MSVALVGTSLSAATARETYTPDLVGGEDGNLNLLAVKVTNNAKGVRIVVSMSSVEWDDAAPMGTYRLQIDTKKSSAGPEFSEDFGIPGDGGFRALKGSKSWKKSWSTYPLRGKCGKSVVERWRLDTGKVIVRIKPKKGCLFHPKRVRVNARTIESGVSEGGEYVEYETPIVDHLPARKTFTAWTKYSRK